jgi:hypothetical protein
MFRPSEARQREYKLLLDARARDKKLPASCNFNKPTNNSDQAFLNAVFWDKNPLLNRARVNSTEAQRQSDSERYVDLSGSGWRVRTVHNAQLEPCLATPTALLKYADTYHFFSNYAPWGRNCSIMNALAGEGCEDDYLQWLYRHVYRQSAPAAARAKLCSGIAAAHAVWYSELFRLPADVRRMCLARLPAGGNLPTYTYQG